MTTSSEQVSERDAMSLMARQVAEGSKTLGLHIKQHDDISEAAQMWAQDVITEGRRQLEESHKQVVEEAAKSFNAATETLRQDAERLTAQLQEQGARDAVSLREAASKLAETSEDLARRLEAGVKAAETAINQGAELLLKEHTAALERAASAAQGQLSQQAENHRELREQQEEEIRQERTTATGRVPPTPGGDPGSPENRNGIRLGTGGQDEPGGPGAGGGQDQ